MPRPGEIGAPVAATPKHKGIGPKPHTPGPTAPWVAPAPTKPGETPPGTVRPAPPSGDLTSDSLGLPGLPPDVAAKVDAIFRDGAPNAAERARAYIRTTPWYAAEYAGIAGGIGTGMFGTANPEAEYRAYKTSVNNLYLSHYGRAATAAELTSFLGSGWDASRIGAMAAGHSYIEANKPELSYLSGAFTEGAFTPEELKAYGEEKSGLGSALGAKISARVDSAMQKVSRVFQGELAQPAQQGIASVLQRQRTHDVSA